MVVSNGAHPQARSSILALFLTVKQDFALFLSVHSPVYDSVQPQSSQEVKTTYCSNCKFDMDMTVNELPIFSCCKLTL